jgi:hypothetical protein
MAYAAPPASDNGVGDDQTKSSRKLAPIQKRRPRERTGETRAEKALNEGASEEKDTEHGQGRDRGFGVGRRQLRQHTSRSAKYQCTKATIEPQRSRKRPKRKRRRIR